MRRAAGTFWDFFTLMVASSARNPSIDTSKPQLFLFRLGYLPNLRPMLFQFDIRKLIMKSELCGACAILVFSLVTDLAVLLFTKCQRPCDCA